jgi:hypothetical protein
MRLINGISSMRKSIMIAKKVNIFRRLVFFAGSILFFTACFCPLANAEYGKTMCKYTHPDGKEYSARCCVYKRNDGTAYEAACECPRNTEYGKTMCQYSHPDGKEYRARCCVYRRTDGATYEAACKCPPEETAKEKLIEIAGTTDLEGWLSTLVPPVTSSPSYVTAAASSMMQVFYLPSGDVSAGI